VFGSAAQGLDRYDSDVVLLAARRPGVCLFDLATMRQEIESEPELVAGTHVTLASKIPAAHRSGA